MNMTSYLNILYNSTYLPMQYYQNNVCKLSLPLEQASIHFVETFLNELISSEQKISYLTTKQFLYIGCVRNTDTNEMVLVGPISTTRIKPESVPPILMESSISPNHTDAVINFFQMTPCFSHEQFLHLLTLIHAVLNDEVVEPYEYFKYDEPSTLNAISSKHSNKLYVAKEEEIFHNTYQFEQQLYHYVEEGNVDAIKKLMFQKRNLETGTIGANSLRQEKNIFIANITLLTRHSIAGGLDTETAYQLSDTYIQESENATSVETITHLSFTALIDFTDRVSANKMPKGMSPDIFQCMQFISTHTNQPISVGDVADAIGKSQSYISKKFKKEMGFNLNSFIMRKKLEEAKSLLTYTDKPLGEISEYLCFSTQSYFQNVFKKKFHVTPYEYRKSTR